MQKIIMVALAVQLVILGNTQELKAGDLVPDITMDSVINYRKSRLKLSDFNNKFIIIEIWSHTCRACILGFPKIDSLQKKFAKDVQFIAVCASDRKSTQALFAKLKNIKMPDIPFVVSDSIVKSRFPHNFVPWQIWLDRDRKVRYISDGSFTNDENIALLIEGKQPKIREVSYLNTSNMNLPLVFEENGKWLDKVEFYSYLSHTILGRSVRNSTIRTEDNISTHPNIIRRNGQDAFSIVRDAFEEGNKYDFNLYSNVELLGIDSFKFLRPAKPQLEWYQKHSYSYELKVPAERAKETYKMMQEDVTRYFNLDVSIFKKNIPCYVLEVTGSINKLRSLGGSSYSNFSLANDTPVRVIRNLPIAKLTYKLKFLIERDLQMLFVDNTDILFNIDLNISNDNFESLRIENINKELQKYGLQLVLKPWEQNILKIKQL